MDNFLCFIIILFVEIPFWFLFPRNRYLKLRKIINKKKVCNKVVLWDYQNPIYSRFILSMSSPLNPKHLLNSFVRKLDYLKVFLWYCWFYVYEKFCRLSDLSSNWQFHVQIFCENHLCCVANYLLALKHRRRDFYNRIFRNWRQCSLWNGLLLTWLNVWLKLASYCPPAVSFCPNAD